MRTIALPILAALVTFTGAAAAAPLTADEAVRIALQKNSQVIQSEASVLDARGGLWSAYTGLLPSVNGNYSLSRLRVDPSDRLQTEVFGGTTYFYRTVSYEQTSRTPSISGQWSIVDLSNWSEFSSARHSMSAARLSRTSTRQQVAFDARRLFYDVVKAIRLSEVSAGALRLSRDDERRVNALFEVGSVSKSDLLKARVRTSQSQLDSLLSEHGVTSTRIALANLLGVEFGAVGEIDTTLVGPHRIYEEQAVRAEARSHRPDLQAAEHEVKAAQAGVNAARWTRLPRLNITAARNFPAKTKTNSQTDFFDSTGTVNSGTQVNDFETTSDPSFRATLGFTMPFFDGLAGDAANARARANLIRVRETRDALNRNLDSEVRQALLSYQEAVERETLGRQTMESASENLHLVQQKYNVGSATILDLIDSQVQLQRAQSDLVSALAAIRVAEAALDLVRGQGE